MAYHEFTLTFKLADASGAPQELAERLGAAGCTDALVGFGWPGYVALNFTREGESFERALETALNDAQEGLRGARLVEVSREGLTKTTKLPMALSHAKGQKERERKMCADGGEKELAARIVGWHRAAAGADVLLEYADAYRRIVGTADLGKSIGGLVNELLNEKRDRLEKGDDCGHAR